MESLVLASAVVEHLAPTTTRYRPVRVNRLARDLVPAPPPSIHVRVVATWVSIFPLVTLGMTVMALSGPITAAWPTWLRALSLTGVVVPTAVYLVVPRVLAVSVRWMSWRRGRSAAAEPCERL
ncbi:hypothetical protein [Rhodococcus wratislaviensis]|uniref:Uncharacterized protein n=1 Tax=Rhodococcus wratislaviensis NBRC 100605 TaxID=1219028 RepID=X0PTH1_RHOWR|nr:hypothetical protein [Rhodococcus wratislaviensis]GAF46379.1 hypothetical protein RW1_030_01210 [Rhodococcus wratislaviensis NBRC 100605]